MITHEQLSALIQGKQLELRNPHTNRPMPPQIVQLVDKQLFTDGRPLQADDNLLIFLTWNWAVIESPKGTWDWALAAMREGKKVARKEWHSYDWWIEMVDDQIYTPLGMCIAIKKEDVDATDWREK